jgi:hypothetical protein
MNKSQAIANAAAVEMMKLLLTVSSNDSDFAKEINQAAAAGNVDKIKELVSELTDEVLAAGLADGLKAI